MSHISSINPNLYQTPSEMVLKSRKTFYSTQKQHSEPISEWFCRIKGATENCNFGVLTDFLVIDKFFCELDGEVSHWLRNSDTWSLDQLFQAISDQPNFTENHKTNNDTQFNTTINQILKVELDNIENDLDDDVPFFNTNVESINSEDDQKLSDLKCQIKKKENKNEDILLNTPSMEKKSEKLKSIKSGQKIKGFTIDAEDRYHCLDCGKSFKQKASYTQHQRLHSGKNLLYCTICNKVFIKPSKLKLHFRKHEREQSVAGKSFECHLCKFQFLRLQGLRIHINLKHVSNIKNSFQCRYCDEVFTQQTTLDDHLRSEHQLNIGHKCPHCNKLFDQDQLLDLKEHLTTHSEIKPFMCEVCGNAFKTRKQLHMHMTRHTNERRFKCGECGQMLKSRSNYKNHLRQHTGERPFKCDHDHCGKTFVQRANYLKHLRWHTGIKPHGCNYCNKRFPTAYDMKLHVNSIHTGAKPFACDFCDSKFSQPSTLRVHKLKVHR